MGPCRVENIDRRAFQYYPRLARLHGYCSDHYSEDITLQRAADIAALERSYFSRYFHAKVGVCFLCWLNCLRIDIAKSKISCSDQSFTRLAQEVGYNNLGSFERAFKRCTGMTAGRFKSIVEPHRSQ